MAMDADNTHAAQAAPMAMVPGIPPSEVLATLDFIETRSQWQVWLDAKAADPAARLIDHAIKLLGVLRRLNGDLSDTSLSPCRIFRARQQPLLFPSLITCIGPDIEVVKHLCDYLILPKELSRACRQQLAVYALLAAESEPHPEGETFVDRLSKDEDLKVMVDAAWASINSTLTMALCKHLREEGWFGQEGPGRAALVDGLTGESLQEKASQFRQSYYTSGCILAGAEPPFASLSKVKSTDEISDEAWLQSYKLAAFLDRADVLDRLRGLRKVFPDLCLIQFASKHGKTAALQWAFSLAKDFHFCTKYLIIGLGDEPGALTSARWFFEEYSSGSKQERRAFEDEMKFVGLASLSLPVLDYLSSQGIEVPVDNRMKALARAGAVDRLSALLEGGAAFVSGTTEAALKVGRRDALELCLAQRVAGSNSPWDQQGHSGLAAACEGFCGSIEMLEYCVSRGCPVTHDAFQQLCDKAAEVGLTGVLEWAAAHPAFPGWGRCASPAVRGAIHGDQEEVIAWITANVPCPARPHDIEWSSRHAVRDGNLRIIKSLKA